MGSRLQVYQSNGDGGYGDGDDYDVCGGGDAKWGWRRSRDGWAREIFLEVLLLYIVQTCGIGSRGSLWCELYLAPFTRVACVDLTEATRCGTITGTNGDARCDAPFYVKMILSLNTSHICFDFHLKTSISVRNGIKRRFAHTFAIISD